MKFVESCGCDTSYGATTINSWYDLQNSAPRNPFDLIANAYLNGTQGVFAYSDTFKDPPGATWIPSPIIYSSEAVCTALESDNFQKVADANQWNFNHQTVNTSSGLALPLHKVIYLRGGHSWQMDVMLDLGTPTNDLQLSFLDNAGTRGDYAGAVPVITFPGSHSGIVQLSLTLHEVGRTSMGLRMIDSGTGDWSMFEMDWVIVS